MAARGMFAATGKVAKAKRKIVPQEFYRTPAEVTRALLNAESHRLEIMESVWEPAAGDGAIADVIEEDFDHLDVYKSDIVDRGCDAKLCGFFDYLSPPSRNIITNPPYSLTNWGGGKGRWITHALNVLEVRYMALLLPWTWPAAGGLETIWKYHPPQIVYLLTWKIDWTGQGAPPQNNAWFVWDKGRSYETILRRLGRP